MREKGEVNSGLNFQIIPDFFMEQKKEEGSKEGRWKNCFNVKDVLLT